MVKLQRKETVIDTEKKPKFHESSDSSDVDHKRALTQLHLKVRQFTATEKKLHAGVFFRNAFQDEEDRDLTVDHLEP